MMRLTVYLVFPFKRSYRRVGFKQGSGMSVRQGIHAGHLELSRVLSNHRRSFFCHIARQVHHAIPTSEEITSALAERAYP